MSFVCVVCVLFVCLCVCVVAQPHGRSPRFSQVIWEAPRRVTLMPFLCTHPQPLRCSDSSPTEMPTTGTALCRMRSKEVIKLGFFSCKTQYGLPTQKHV